MTPMEALLSGCGVLVNDDPAMRTLALGDGVEELAVTPERLRDRLEALAADPTARAALAERGRRVAVDLPTWEDHLDVVEGVLAEAARG